MLVQTARREDVPSRSGGGTPRQDYITYPLASSNAPVKIAYGRTSPLHVRT
jgi:hypothetical protein